MDGGDIGNVLVSIQNIPQIGSHNRNPVAANQAVHHITASPGVRLTALLTKAEFPRADVLKAVREASK